MRVLILLGLIALIFSSQVDLMVQLKNINDISKLSNFGLSKHITFESILPETKTPRENTETLMMLERYFFTQIELDVAQTIQSELLSKDFINAAYIAPKSELPTVRQTPNYQHLQGYLNKSIEGVDMYHARTFPGGRGEDVTVVDLEGDWDFDHEDLKEHNGRIIYGARAGNSGWTDHGSAVLGEIAGVDNNFGVTGIASKAKIFGASIYTSPGVQGPPAKAMIAAADFLKAGDVLLIELHRVGPAGKFIAMEWWHDNFLALKYATQKGVVVVEAAGNGAENLDNPVYNRPQTGFPPEWKNPFNRTLADCGAILCGASAPPSGNFGPQNSRLDFSNYGNSLDVNGWGREVVTLGYGDLQRGTRQTFYTRQFSGTSSASPIATGSVAAMQGIAKKRGKVLSPAQFRKLFRETGSPQVDHPQRPKTQRIGNRPNLKQMIERSVSLGYISK